MKLLIIGAAGFIGSHAAEKFQKEGFEVTGMDKFFHSGRWRKFRRPESYSIMILRPL